MTSKYLRKPAVLERVPVSDATLDRWVAAGLFPKPVKLGPRAVAWLESQIESWEAARVQSHETIHDQAADGAETTRTAVA
ncbi:MAG: AlpA family phage regulatory protein [Hyphomicrobiales bacterium]|nr:MAG: AlpA family phage regulatory protein [Hyphomicrobiales bacterium]